MFKRHFAVWPEGVPHSIDVPEWNIAENLRITAERKPDKPAILYHGASMTFAELHAQSERLAGWLVQVAAVAPGDRVLLYMQNSPQFVIGYYAILRANAVVVPVNPMNRGKELDHLIADTGAQVALAGQEILEHLRPFLKPGRLRACVAAAYADLADPAFDIPLPVGLEAPSPTRYDISGVTAWTDAVRESHDPGPLTAGPDDLAVIPYTSGTTGQQKGCLHTIER